MPWHDPAKKTTIIMQDFWGYFSAETEQFVELFDSGKLVLAD